MLKKSSPIQTELEMGTLESLLPADHLLRKVEAAIDFRFIRDLTEGLYCPDNGRPPIPSEVLFKALFIGYLFGIRSERELMREIEVNHYRLTPVASRLERVAFNRFCILRL